MAPPTPPQRRTWQVQAALVEAVRVFLGCQAPATGCTSDQLAPLRALYFR